MYNISLYSSVLHDKTGVLAIYSALIEKNYIVEPKIFFDKRLINLKESIPALHAWHLCGAQELTLTDNTVYDIANIFPSNRFMCIDQPCRHQAPNVDHYSIEEFAKSKDQETTLKMLLDILNKKEYEKYAIQQIV